MNKKLLHFWCLSSLMVFAVSAQTWTDISTTLISRIGPQPREPYGCSGLAVNRLNGDVYAGVLWIGLWKSANKGQDWTQLDNDYFTGTCNNAWSLQVDQNQPNRITVFALDGTGCYTADGTNWIKMNYIGRGWDFGSVDWADPQAKVMVTTCHETGGNVYKTTDGGQNWTLLPSIKVNGYADVNAMLGVMDANTFVAGNSGGIYRSTDAGSSWSQVSTVKTLGHTTIQFNGKFYIGTASGLLASADKGATWHIQGKALNIYQGPFFGADENTMVVVGTGGVYKTTDAGTNWTKISSLYPNTDFDLGWMGCYTWDPIGNVVYACRMTYPAYRYQLPTTRILDKASGRQSPEELTFVNSTISATVRFTHVEIFSLIGCPLFRRTLHPTNTLVIPQLKTISGASSIIRVTTENGDRLTIVR